MTKNQLLSTVFGLALGLAATSAVAQDAVKIGVLTDLSGTYSDISGQGSVVATKMAIDDFIAKEKPSFKIDLVSADHQNKADIAANKSREWFENDGVDVVTGAGELLLDYAERKMRAGIAAMPDGVYKFDDVFDNAEMETEIPLSVEITISGDEMKASVSLFSSLRAGKFRLKDVMIEFCSPFLTSPRFH